MDYLQFSLSYPFNRELDEAGNDDDSVEFISDLRVPCLICGNFKEIDNIIKEEVSETFGDNVNYAQGHNESVDVNVDSSVFHSFLKWFRVEITKKGKQRLVDRGWDGEGGDILRFCANCKLELVGILEMQQELERLEKKINIELEEVKVKMERSEKIFQINGIYENDKRYKLVRSSILNTDSVEETSTGDKHQTLSLRQLVNHNSSRIMPGNEPNTNNGRSDVITSTIIENADVPMETVNPSITVSSLPAVHYPTPNLPAISLNIISNTQANPRKLLAKTDKKVAVRKSPDKRSQRKFSNRLSIRNKKVLGKISNRKPYKVLKNPVREKVSTRKLSEMDKAAVEQDKHKTRLRRNGRPVNYTEINLDDDDEDGSSNNNSLTYEYTNKVDSAKEKVQNTVCRRKSSRIAKILDQSKFRMQKSPEISKAIFEAEANGLKPGKMKIPPIPKRSLRQPIINFHSSRFACPKCLFKTDCKKVLDAHIKCLHRGLCGPQLFPCSICEKPIAYRQSRTNHEWTHMNKQERKYVLLNEPNRIPDWMRKNWPCDKCEKKFSQERQLKRHVELCHEGKSRDICPQCGKAVANLRHHIRYNHVHKKRFQCTEENCGKVFKMIGELTRHKNCVHCKVKPWKCTSCAREFAWKENFNRHMELHVGIRSWKCNVKGCGSAFVTKRDLKRHNTSCHREPGF